MKIKVLGSGCPKCRQLEKSTRDAVEELGINAQIEKVENIMEIMKYGIAATPALVVDEVVVVKGRIPAREELIKIIQR